MGVFIKPDFVIFNCFLKSFLLNKTDRIANNNKIQFANAASGMKRQRMVEIKTVVNIPLMQTREKLAIG